jgi:hypothetical protein
METDPTFSQSGARLRTADPDARREAARLMGSARTPAKAEAARRNANGPGRKANPGGRPLKPLAEIPCSCGAGDSMEHKTYCLRGQAIRRRQKAGKL